MYRQQSVPSLSKKLTKGRNSGPPSTRGVRVSSPANNAVQRTSSERILAVSEEREDLTKNSRDEAALRAKALEQIEFLESHLAGCILEFLIEEVEKNVLKAYTKAARMGDETDKDDENNEIDHNKYDDLYQSYSEVEEDLTDHDSARIFGSQSAAKSQQPAERKVNAFPRRMEDGSGTSLGNSLRSSTIRTDSSPKMPSRGLRTPDAGTPMSPPQGLSPRLNSTTSGAMLYRNFNLQQHPGQLVLSTNNEEEEVEEEDITSLVSPTRVNGNKTNLASHTPAYSRTRNIEKSPTVKETVKILKHKEFLSAATNSGTRPRLSRSLDEPSKTDGRPRLSRNFANGDSSTSPKRPAVRPELTSMMKQGSVRNMMSIFDSKPSRPTRPGMHLLREESVKNIVNSLKDCTLCRKNDDATDPNEASDASNSKANGKANAPPSSIRDFSSSPKRLPERGVPRLNSGIRMQRFLENRPVKRTNSGQKAFLSKKGSGSSHSSTRSGGTLNRVARKGSGNVKRGVERSSSGMRRGIPRRQASAAGSKRGLMRRQFSFDSGAGTKKSSSFGMFAKDKVDNQLSHDTRKQKRIFKTQNALRKLKKAHESSMLPDRPEESESSQEDNVDMEHILKAMSLPLPCGIKHECALLFVDISGFTKLSTTLKVEKLSKTINAYFQLIVEHVQSFGGDILKFAGDAVFAEWRASSNKFLEVDEGDPMGGSFGGKGLGAEKAVVTAAACAARIIDKCADYKVYDDNGKEIATLNLHCAIGFGEVLGAHVGNSDRMEYFIIGEPISQVAKAMDLGNMGEVVASPDCLKFLDDETAKQPRVILSKTNKLMNPKLILVKAEMESKCKIGDRLADWDIAALRSLQKLMSPYVHPVVVENQLFQKGYGSAQERFTSEAEIRDVFTVFIQPMISSDITGSIEDDKKVLKGLHDILLLVNAELRRFKGQLRQYTVDDKGIVLIANFGLRGSTFPQMVERLAMPFAANVQQILKAKLDIECKMGATYGKAYCGVVGGVDRHEYAVLGPSVNLAARLMTNKSNKGFLVDEEVQRKASNRGFEGLAPVKAKGYKQLVPIFQPVLQHRNSWGSEGTEFVGRTSEIKQILKGAEDIIDATASTSMVWVSAESGYGKSALLGQAIEKVSDLCSSKSATYVIVCHVCSDADSFQPLSVVGPLFLDMLAFVRRANKEDGYKKPSGFDEVAALAKIEKAPLQILGACRDADVPDWCILTICNLLIARVWPDEADKASMETQVTEVARYLVTVLLQSTIYLDFVVWAIDDIPHADLLSWKVLELLHQYSCNFMLLMGSRPVVGSDMNIDLQFWEDINSTGEINGTFLPLALKALTKDDLGLLVKRYAAKYEWDASIDLSSVTKNIFVQSGGVPNLAAQILEKTSDRITGKVEVKSRKASEKKSISPNNSLSRLDMMKGGYQRPSTRSVDSGSTHGGSVAQLDEHMLHRMDLLTPEARTHINLGAILGPAFESADVISIMERYRGISDQEREDHRQSVLESLAQAAESGILEEDLTGAGNSMSFCAQENFTGQDSITYKFTHADWRKNILKVVLDSWKRAMYLLLAESLEARFEFKNARPDRAIRKLFDPFKGGKKKGKNISVASELALKIGTKLENLGKGIHSMKIYQRALDLWLKPDEEGDILVMSEEDHVPTIDELVGEELEYVLKLNVALGHCAMLLMNQEKCMTAFQDNLERVPDLKDLNDPVILFPSFAGRFYSLRLSRKIDYEPEADFVYGFVDEAEAHKNTIHTLQALAMEAELLGRNGEYLKALEASSDLRKQYDVSTHSSKLIELYGDDYSAQCLAQSANWHLQLKQEAKAKEICDSIIDILPKLALSCHFQTLYPILWVLKDLPGQAERALELCHLFLKVDESKDNDGLDDDANDEANWDVGDDNAGYDDEPLEKPFSPFQVLHKPIATLLQLTVGVNDTKVILQYVDWALDASQSEYGKGLNLYTGSLGRNADSIVAEICLNLATYSVASSAKHGLLSRASALVTASSKFTKYMPSAYQQVKKFSHDEKFRNL